MFNQFEHGLEKIKTKTNYQIIRPPVLKFHRFSQINKDFQRKIVNIVLPINFSICFGCSKEPSH